MLGTETGVAVNDRHGIYLGTKKEYRTGSRKLVCSFIVDRSIIYSICPAQPRTSRYYDRNDYTSATSIVMIQNLIGEDILWDR